MLEEFHAMVTFFGEDPHLVTTSDIFNIFSQFLEKFEVMMMVVVVTVVVVVIMVEMVIVIVVVVVVLVVRMSVCVTDAMKTTNN